MSVRLLLQLLLIASPTLLWAIPDLFISGAVAQVRDHVITLRELRIAHMIMSSSSSGLVLEGQQESPTDKPLPQSPSDLKNLARQWTQGWMIYLEAENFGVAQVQSAELEEALKKVQVDWSGHSLWQSQSPTRSELIEFMNVWIRSQRFLRYKRESTAVSVSDAEVKKYYEQNRLKFGNLPFERFQENIKRYLTSERLNQRMQEWVEVLERKYEVKSFKLPGESIE